MYLTQLFLLNTSQLNGRKNSRGTAIFEKETTFSFYKTCFDIPMSVANVQRLGIFTVYTNITITSQLLLMDPNIDGLNNSNILVCSKTDRGHRSNLCTSLSPPRSLKKKGDRGVSPRFL